MADESRVRSGFVRYFFVEEAEGGFAIIAFRNYLCCEKPDNIMKSDIQIAQESKLLPIVEVAKKIGIPEEDLELGNIRQRFHSPIRTGIFQSRN